MSMKMKLGAILAKRWWKRAGEGKEGVAMQNLVDWVKRNKVPLSVACGILCAGLASWTGEGADRAHQAAMVIVAVGTYLFGAGWNKSDNFHREEQGLPLQHGIAKVLPKLLLVAMLPLMLTACGQGEDITGPSVAALEPTPAPTPQQTIISLAMAVRVNGILTAVTLPDTEFTVESGPRCANDTLPCPRVSRVNWQRTGAFCEQLGDKTGPAASFVCYGFGIAEIKATDLDSGATGTASVLVLPIFALGF